MSKPLISIVVPCKNEAPNLPPLLDEIEHHMTGRAFEVLVVDDGSTDDTAAVLGSEVSARAFGVRHIRHDRSGGQSIAVRSGALAAKGTIIVTIDGDGQNDPAYIPKLVDRLTDAGPATALVAGQRTSRKDTKAKQLASRFANGLRSAILHDRTRDSGCGLKAVRADVLRRVPFFNGTHRFLPALVIQEGFDVAHIDVVDRPRRHGVSNYGIFDRGLRGALDLFGVWWLGRRRRNMPQAMEVTKGQEFGGSG